MPMVTVSPEEYKAREEAMRAKTASQLLIEAAEIIEKDPMLTPSSYTEPRWVNKITGEAPFTYYTDKGPAASDDWELKPCHCLEGAMQEAGGVFTTDPALPGWLVIVKGLERVWGEVWERTLNEVLVKQFDVTKLQNQQHIYSDCNTIQEAVEKTSANDVVYAYSDRVLAPLGRQGVIEAARLLRAAAESLTKEA